MSTYYHGGPGGLVHIMPHRLSGARLTSAEFGNNVTRADRVYVCADFNGALLYAAMHPADSVSVYTVAPIGEIEADPDCTEAELSFMCAEASVSYERKIGRALRMGIVSAMMHSREESPPAPAPETEERKP